MNVEINKKAYTFGSNSFGDVYIIEGIVQSITDDCVKLVNVKEIRSDREGRMHKKSVSDTEYSKQFLELSLEEQACLVNEAFRAIVIQLEKKRF